MKIKERCYRLVTYIIGHYCYGPSSGKVWGHGTPPFLSKVDRYTLGVSTLWTLGGQGLTPQTCNSHRKFVSSSSPRVVSLKGLGLVVPEQVRHAPYRAESNYSPRRRAMNLWLTVKQHLNVRTLLAKYQVYSPSGSPANAILRFGRFEGRNCFTHQGGEQWTWDSQVRYIS